MRHGGFQHRGVGAPYVVRSPDALPTDAPRPMATGGVILALGAAAAAFPSIAVPATAAAMWLAFRHLSRTRAEDAFRNDHVTGRNPDAVPEGAGLLLGTERGSDRQLWLSREECRKHVLVVGTEGSGLSTMALSMVGNALATGRGCLLLSTDGDETPHAHVDALASACGRAGDVVHVGIPTVDDWHALPPDRRPTLASFDPYEGVTGDEIAAMLRDLFEADLPKDAKLPASVVTLCAAVAAGFRGRACGGARELSDALGYWSLRTARDVPEVMAYLAILDEGGREFQVRHDGIVGFARTVLSTLAQDLAGAGAPHPVDLREIASGRLVMVATVHDRLHTSGRTFARALVRRMEGALAVAEPSAPRPGTTPIVLGSLGEYLPRGTDLGEAARRAGTTVVATARGMNDLVDREGHRMDGRCGVVIAMRVEDEEIARKMMYGGPCERADIDFRDVKGQKEGQFLLLRGGRVTRGMGANLVVPTMRPKNPILSGTTTFEEARA